MKEAKELLEIFDKNVPQKMDLEKLKKKMKFKFIVVEGLDAGGMLDYYIYSIFSQQSLSYTVERNLSLCFLLMYDYRF